MIKVLKEEPVAYDTDYGIEDGAVWIYKNPDRKEVEEVLNLGENYVRVLIHLKDYYIASALHLLHRDMVAILKDYNNLNYNNYVHAVIDINKNAINLGESSLNGNISFEEDNFKEFKNIYNKLLEVNLIDDDTKIIDEYSMSKIKPQLLKDFLNNNTLEESKLKEQIITDTGMDKDTKKPIWIYKNPTQNEIDISIYNCREGLRILINPDNNNVYIAPDYYTTHYKMAKNLYQTEHTVYDYYLQLFYDSDSNKIQVGDYYNKEDIDEEFFNLFISKLPRLLQLGIINNSTIIGHSNNFKHPLFNNQRVSELI